MKSQVKAIVRKILSFQYHLGWSWDKGHGRDWFPTCDTRLGSIWSEQANDEWSCWQGQLVGSTEGDAAVSEAEQAGVRLLQGLAGFPTSCLSLLTASSPTVTCGELNASAPKT